MNEKTLGNSEIKSSCIVDIEHALDLEGDLEAINMTRQSIETANETCTEFYGYGMNIPTSVYITDRVGLDACEGQPTPDYVVAINHSKGIYLLDPRLYDSQSNKIFTEERYEKTIKHELGHRYLRGITGIPFENSEFYLWFNEGIQMYIAGQDENALNYPFDIDALEDRYNSDFYGSSIQIIRKIAREQGDDILKLGANKIFNNLKNTYIEINNRSDEEVNLALEDTFSRSFEEAFGISTSKDELEKFMID